MSLENTNDLRTEAKGVTHSEEWTGTTRFQMQGYKRVNGRPTTIQESTRPDSIWLEAWIRFSLNQQQT